MYQELKEFYNDKCKITKIIAFYHIGYKNVAIFLYNNTNDDLSYNFKNTHNYNNRDIVEYLYNKLPKYECYS